MKVVILQPSYIPWRGYFHQIAIADLFVFYDDVKFDKNGWRNRNRIKTPLGGKWLTIPVKTTNLETLQIPINQIRIDNSQNWQIKHWSTIFNNYQKAPHYNMFAATFQEYFLANPELLVDFIIPITKSITKILGFTNTQFINSSDITGITGTKTDRLIAILREVGATEYISGPAAKNYLEEDKFLQNRIKLEYMKYEYPEYPQLYPPFEPYVSILDLLLMTGKSAANYIL